MLRPGQRRTFRATFRLRTNVTAATVTNGASVDTPNGSGNRPVHARDRTTMRCGPPWLRVSGGERPRARGWLNGLRG